MLEAAGATVVSTSDSEEAERLIIDNPGVWSVLLTDLDMPVVDGVRLAQAARHVDPAVPVVLATALPEKLANDTGLFCAVLSKPVDAAHLSAAILAAARRCELADHD